MIRISDKYTNVLTGEPVEKHLSGSYYITYHVGEITRIKYEGGSYGFRFCDSDGVSFTLGEKWCFARYYASVIILPEDNRIPLEYRDKYKGSLYCSDPRVVWLTLVNQWIPCPKEWNDEFEQDRQKWLDNAEKRNAVTSQILTALIPSYDEAIELLKRNGFPPLNADSAFYEVSRSGEDSEYYENSSALKFPPKINWDDYSLSSNS